MEEALPATEQACEPPGDALLGDAEVAIADVGRALHSRDEYAIGPGGAFEACAYGRYLVRVLTDAADAMRLTGTDAIAAAYPILELPPIPVDWSMASGVSWSRSRPSITASPPPPRWKSGSSAHLYQ